MPAPSDFQLATAEVRDPVPDEVVVRNLFMAVDPYMRGRMNDAPSYVPPFELGQPLDGGSVGRVIASRSPAFREGDLVVSGRGGWREIHVGKAASCTAIRDPVEPLSLYLGFPTATSGRATRWAASAPTASTSPSTTSAASTSRRRSAP